MVVFTVLVVLTSTVFSLASVEVNFLATPTILTNYKQIVDSGQFRFGENVLTSGKEQYIKNIEEANPYIRVVNIETVFPNKYIIHAAERTETYVFKLDNNKFAKTDEHLKILNIANTYQNNTTNAIQVFGSTATSQSSLTEGKSFDAENLLLKNLFVGFREWIDDYATIKSKVKSIELNHNGNENCVAIDMHSGVQIVVNGANSNTSDKLNLAFSIYDSTTDKNGQPFDFTQSGIIQVFETETQIYANYIQAN